MAGALSAKVKPMLSTKDIEITNPPVDNNQHLTSRDRFAHFRCENCRFGLCLSVSKSDVRIHHGTIWEKQTNRSSLMGVSGFIDKVQVATSSIDNLNLNVHLNLSRRGLPNIHNFDGNGYGHSIIEVNQFECRSYTYPGSLFESIRPIRSLGKMPTDAGLRFGLFKGVVYRLQLLASDMSVPNGRYESTSGEKTQRELDPKPSPLKAILLGLVSIVLFLKSGARLSDGSQRREWPWWLLFVCSWVFFGFSTCFLLVWAQ